MKLSLKWMTSAAVICLMMSGCDQPAPEDTAYETQPAISEEIHTEEDEMILELMIEDTAVTVEWENNQSVEALKKLCADQPLSISMAMYGGFEQVGPIGTRLPSNDVQTTTSYGDIVLYSSDQIVMFYGSNSWAYTRLGHVTDKTQEEMTELLGNGDVTITLRMGEEK
jgi:hypothetical protein